jgi:5-methylcytosine-specific restriction endonuclease McrA
VKRTGAPRRKTELKWGAPPKRKTQLRSKTEFRTTATPKRRKRINPISDKKRKADEVYAENRKFVLERENYICEAKIFGHCIGRASETNHIKKRSHGNDHSVSNLMAVCRPCHHVIETNPEFAMQRGFAVSGHQKFKERPSWHAKEGEAVEAPNR